MPDSAPSTAAVEVLLAVWLFAAGGAVGSFLNVVIYRLPKKMSLLQPGSHCPACARPIRWYHNIPILGWFVLGGRCWDCKARISLRYPLVEAITAAMFLGVGLVEGLSRGANLPPRPIPVASGWSFQPPSGVEASGLVAYHLLVLCTLLAAAFLEYDGHRLPLRLVLPALAIGALAPLGWPWLRPVPAFACWSGWIAGLADGAVGLAVGLLLGLAAWGLVGPPDRRSLLVGPAGLGLFFGWQAGLLLGIAGLILHGAVLVLGRTCPGLRRLSPAFWLAALAAGWLPAWKGSWETVLRPLACWSIVG
ncbi:MAG: prepilin peptidase [Thermoguttaceae bacterium]